MQNTEGGGPRARAGVRTAWRTQRRSCRRCPANSASPGQCRQLRLQDSRPWRFHRVHLLPRQRRQPRPRTRTLLSTCLAWPHPAPVCRGRQHHQPRFLLRSLLTGASETPGRPLSAHHCPDAQTDGWTVPTLLLHLSFHFKSITLTTLLKNSENTDVLKKHTRAFRFCWEVIGPAVLV